MKGLLGDRSVTIGLGRTTKGREWCLREETAYSSSGLVSAATC